MRNLKKRGNKYYVVYYVPTFQIESYGKREAVRTTGVDDYKEALKLRPIILAELRDMVNAACDPEQAEKEKAERDILVRAREIAKHFDPVQEEIAGTLLSHTYGIRDGLADKYELEFADDVAAKFYEIATRKKFPVSDALKLWASVATGIKEATLSLSKITLKPDVFQPRGIDERHIKELERAIKISGRLEPLKVIQIGELAVLLDGHHRVAAYEAAGVTEDIPVMYFEGTLDEAVLESGRTNSKAKLPMTTRDRQEYGWRLVLLNAYSKRQIREAAGISDGQVGLMRRAMKSLGDEAYDAPSWLEALETFQGREREELSDDEREAKLKAQAGDYADRLSKEFGTKLSNNVTLAAMALEIHFGRRLPELVRELRWHLPSDEDDTELDY